VENETQTHSVHYSFYTFPMFLFIFQVPQCLCFFFHIFQFSRRSLCPTVCIFHFPLFSVFSPYSMSYSVCVLFSRFSVFSPFSRSYHVSFSFSFLVRFLATFQVLQSVFLLFHLFHCFSPYSRSYSVCLYFFSTFISYFQVLQCAYLIFQLFQCISPYFRSYSVWVSFSTFFQFLCHIPSPTMCISHF